MYKHLLLLFLLAGSSIGYSQSITHKGKVNGPDNLPLEAATIYLTSVKDSTVIDYTISEKNGNWELRTRKITQPVHLKVSFVGFANYKQEYASLEKDTDFGIIKLEDIPTELNEIVIQSEIPPIRIKQDTLEFDASSFKVRPDANVESLLKQLPGVEIDSEGKITVNGKEVNEILVDGKPFFDKDGKIALQNLPADIIDKVQVTDTKTKDEELAGIEASGNNASINLTIEDGKNKGLFGKLTGGYGSSKRYESSGLLNYFKDKQRISVLASTNNINSVGFSMNEIFDSMGGGRNNSIWVNDDGGFGINGMQFGGGSGITRSDMFGTNYADEWFKGFDSSLSYFYSSANTSNDNRTRQVTFLPDEDDNANEEGPQNSYTTESSSSTDSDRYSHNLNTEFEFKIDSTSSIVATPRFVKAKSKTMSRSEQFSVDENNQLLNESEAYTYDESDNNRFTNELYYNKNFKRKGRSINMNVENENSVADEANLNRSTTIFYEDPDEDGTITPRADVRDQVRYNRKVSDVYFARIQYYEPITDSLRLDLSAHYRFNRNLEDRVGYDFDETTGEYSSLNAALTNYLTSKISTLNPSAGFYLTHKWLSLGMDMGTQISQFDNYSLYLGNEYILNRHFLLPSANVNLNIKFTKTLSLWGDYNYNVDFPTAEQVLPVADVSNPLVTYVGNPDLEPNKAHNFYVGLYDYDWPTRSGYSIYAGGNFYDSQVVSSTLIDESAKRTTTYENISGTVWSWIGGNWSKTIKREAHSFKFNIGLNGSFYKSKGFINGELYDSRRVTLTPRFNFNYEYGELLTINPSYEFNYTEYDYKNFTISSASNVVHKLKLETTSYWPKGVVFGNDFNYTYNSNIADGFRKDFFLWNTSLGYNFLKDTFLFKVKVYDVLNQNLSTIRTISPTTIRDEQNTVLKRYVMFSLTYKLEKFGGKKKNENFFIDE